MNKTEIKLNKHNKTIQVEITLQISSDEEYLWLGSIIKEGMYSIVPSIFFTDDNFLPQLDKEFKNIKDKYCYDLNLYIDEVIKILDKLNSKKGLMIKTVTMTTEEQVKDYKLYKELGKKKYEIMKDLENALSI
jgi:hypothetical protein